MQSELANTTTYRKADNIVSRPILDETILVPISGNLADMQCIFSFEALGAFIWELLDGSNDLNAIHSRILDEYDVEPAQAMADLREFVSELHAAGLIREREQ